MALVRCKECGGEVSDRALMCPHCGLALRPGPWGFEYRSRTRLFGLPLIHVVGGYGWGPVPARPRVARGIVAVGPVAVGVLAFGGLAVGLVSVGGLAGGLLLAAGGCAVGGLALGGAAVGVFAVGGLAAGCWAFGGAAFAVHPFPGSPGGPSVLPPFRG